MIHTQILANTVNEELGEMFSAARWAYAGKMTLLGMMLVFFVLGLLWVTLGIFRIVMTGKTEKKKKSAHEKTEVTPQIAVTSGTQVQQKAEPQEDPAALIAAITAAVTAYREEEGRGESSSAFRVVAFRPISKKRSWNQK